MDVSPGRCSATTVICKPWPRSASRRAVSRPITPALFICQLAWNSTPSTSLHFIPDNYYFFTHYVCIAGILQMNVLFPLLVLMVKITQRKIINFISEVDEQNMALGPFPITTKPRRESRLRDTAGRRFCGVDCDWWRSFPYTVFSPIKSARPT